MDGALTTLAVVTLVGAVLAVPVTWLQRRLARRAAGKAIATAVPPVSKGGLAAPGSPSAETDGRIAELERALASARSELRAAHETLALHRTLQERYERIIATLSPGLLGPVQAVAPPPVPEPLPQAAE